MFNGIVFYEREVGEWFRLEDYFKIVAVKSKCAILLLLLLLLWCGCAFMVQLLFVEERKIGVTLVWLSIT